MEKEDLKKVICGFIVRNLVLNLSVLYKREMQYFPINPPAALALINMLRANFKADSEESKHWMDFLDTSKEPDERSRPFERVLASTIVTNGVNLCTTKLDGSDPQHITLKADVMKFFSEAQKINRVDRPTLYVPKNKSFPAVDLIYLTPEKVTLLQLTFMTPLEKVPDETNSYSAIYSNGKYKALNSPLGLDGNLATHLLAFTNHPVKTIERTADNLLDENKISVLPYFEYIIISTSEEKSKKAADRFPWIRVVDRRHLNTWLPDSTISALPGSIYFN